MDSWPRAWKLAMALALPGACGGEFEGHDAGECTDDADNDRDGLFDCADPDCAGPPACAASDDTVPPSDTEPPDDTDAPPTPTPTDSGEPVTTDSGNWTSARPPGPHPREVGLVSAWLQDHDNPDSGYGAGCTHLDDPDWSRCSTPPPTTGPSCTCSTGCPAPGRRRCASGAPAASRSPASTTTFTHTYDLEWVRAE